MDLTGSDCFLTPSRHFMDNTLMLHILRNPYGWGEDQVREARLAAADLIEDLSARLAKLDAPK